MNRQRTAKVLLILTVVISLGLAVGAWRFYQIIPVLRSPVLEYAWQFSVIIPLLLAGVTWHLYRPEPQSPAKPT